MKRAHPVRRHRWWRRRRQRPVPPDEGRLDGRRAPGAARADGRLHMARGRRHAHAQRRPERRPPPAVHDPAVRGDRAGLRPGLLHPPARRPDAGRHGGPHGLPADGRRARPLSRDGPGPHLGKGSAGPLPAAGSAVLRRGAVRPGRGPRGPVRRHPRLREVRPGWPAPRSTSTRPSSGLSQRPGRHLGRRASRAATRSTPSTSSMPAACGPARSGGWSASSCRSWPWSTIYLSPRTCPRSPPTSPGPAGDADGARLRGRDLHPPGRRVDAPGHLRAGVCAVVAEGRPRGTSGRSC